MTTRSLSCRELDDRLGDYLEGTLEDSSVADIELHLSACPSCAALVRDLERIVRDAAALAPIVPNRDLWDGIEARIAEPVVDLSARAGARGSGQSVAWRRMRTGAIAAGLMAIGASASWWVARSSSAPVVAVSPGAAAASAATAPSTDSAPRQPTDVSALPETQVAEAVPAGTGTRTTLAARTSAARTPEATYDGEIADLRGALRQRREELDPRTIAVIESSIATIDSAIAQARTALQRDPSSRFLSEQLNKALGKKLGLLRTAALLPART